MAYRDKYSYFGRNLDIEKTYGESVIITPRGYKLKCKDMPDIAVQYAIIGIGIHVDGYPLYYDAANEKGLGIAGLNFPEYAQYQHVVKGKTNATPYELIPWILSCCKTTKDVKKLLKNINITNVPFNDSLPLASLHWLVSDTEGSIVIESTKKGLFIYDNQPEILTNNPPFEFQITNLNNYINLTSKFAENRFSSKINLSPYSLGMGAIGMPGDNSSCSRFVRAAFSKLNCSASKTETECINQFFHILSSVSVIKGTVETKSENQEYTVYSCCCNLEKGIYYYKTYNNSCISSVDIQKENLNCNQLITYPLVTECIINKQN